LILSPFLTHFILVDRADSLSAPITAILLCQGLVTSTLIGVRLTGLLRMLAVALVMTGTVVLALFHQRGSLVVTSGAPHALIYANLLFIFGFSLFSGREPIVTYFARMIHGKVSREIAAYTRNVTWVWCWFFALQLAGSALLLALAPIAWWSTFVNVLNLPLIVAVMLGEKLTRPFWVTNPPREHLSDFLRMPQLLRQGSKQPGVQAL